MIFIVFYVIFRPQAKSPTLLNLPRAESNESVEAADSTSSAYPVPQSALVSEEKALPPVKPAVKSPQIYFVYNGHEWNSYEVLGLAADDGLQAATKIYQNLIKTSDASTFEFYEAAYNAILKRKKE